MSVRLSVPYEQCQNYWSESFEIRYWRFPFKAVSQIDPNYNPAVLNETKRLFHLLLILEIKFL
jgi:hypothetical protein